MVQVNNAPIHVSVVIPVYNEKANVIPLFDRLISVLDGTYKQYEIIFVNDGSTDGSREILRDCFERRPRQVRVIGFNGNYGQHMAVMAAFEIARGEIVITLDADLQNPPEEIPKLLTKFEEGYDVVGGYRSDRRDPAARRMTSRLMNWLREKLTDIRMDEPGVVC